MDPTVVRKSERAFSDRFAILTFTGVVILLSLASWIRYFLHPEDRLFPLFFSADRFNDLLNYSGKMLHLERHAAYLGKGYPVFNYLAPAAYCYHALLITPDPVFTFQAIVFGSFLALLATAATLLVRKRLFRWQDALGLVAILVSFPMSFVLYRANLEGLVFVAVTLSLCFFLRRWYVASAVMLALAMSIKPFPALLLCLFLARRQYRAALLSVGLAAVLVGWALAELGPGVLTAYHGLQHGVSLYTHDYLRSFRSPYEQEYSHGVLDALRTVYIKRAWLHDHIEPAKLVGQLTPSNYLAIYGAAASVIAVLMLVKLRDMPLLNQVMGACIALTLLPPSAADYTLCSLYMPALLLGYYLVTQVRSGRVRWSGRQMVLILLPLAALLSPLNLFGFWTNVVRLVLLLLLTAGVLTEPLALSALDGASLVPRGSGRHAPLLS